MLHLGWTFELLCRRARSLPYRRFVCFHFFLVIVAKVSYKMFCDHDSCSLYIMSLFLRLSVHSNLKRSNSFQMVQRNGILKSQKLDEYHTEKDFVGLVWNLLRTHVLNRLRILRVRSSVISTEIPNVGPQKHIGQNLCVRSLVSVPGLILVFWSILWRSLWYNSDKKVLKKTE